MLKLRGTAGERQTHHEDLPYTELLDRLGNVPPNLVTSTAPWAARSRRRRASRP
ncbi:DUF6716 putative glycosyltransferase [Microbacterium sp. MEC084]|uniref:DUF6716 putative glycosyltransferase n=1 Tax=Microbacterium sp. MEC084 TaxID=1963027 RepID=UPI0035AC1AFE